MTTGWILVCIMMVVFGLLGLIGTLMRISEQAKKDLLEKILNTKSWKSNKWNNANVVLFIGNYQCNYTICIKNYRCFINCA